jgi:hypothetical protein
MKNRSTEKERTLKIRRPFGRTILLAAILLIILLVLVETAARTDFVRDALPAPSIASGHNKLDLKLFLLDNLIKEAGRVDCIFLGGSDANAAINPEIFSRVFEKRTGEKLICFNFGLAGFIPPAAALIAKILVEKYHPRLLVWGFTPSTFGDEFKRKPTGIVTRNPWCRYRLGDFNFEGWLTEHSYAYRYFLRFRTWLERPDYSDELSKREERISKYGYHTPERIGRVMRFKRDEEKENRFREILSKFDIAVKAAAALEQVLRLHSQTKIVLVDIPVHSDLLTLHERGVDVNRKIAAYIKKRAGQKGVLFLSANRFGFIPEKGYKDLSHMNTTGAKIFSRWLGRQIAKAVRKGLITIPVLAGPDSTPIEE